MNGSHTLKHWSRMQSNIALSSAEAELYACNKAAAECIGISHLCNDLGKEKGVQIMIDASATKGILMKQGIGRLKHLEVQELWLQECVDAKRLTIHKIPRNQNCSDALTHHWSPKDAENHFTVMGLSPTPLAASSRSV